MFSGNDLSDAATYEWCHFSQLGFSFDGAGDGVERWRLSVDGAEPLETFIAVDTPMVSA